MNVVMSYSDLLKWTESDGETTRIQAFSLPRDPALQERFCLVLAGPNAGHLLHLIINALDAYFDEGAAQRNSVDTHGPDSSTQRPE